MGAAPGADLWTDYNGDEVVVHARGELDLDVAEYFTQAVKSAGDEAPLSCILDLEQVTYIDSEIIKSLLALQKYLAGMGIALYIRKCSPAVLRVFRMLGIEARFSEVACIGDC